MHVGFLGAAIAGLLLAAFRIIYLKVQVNNEKKKADKEKKKADAIAASYWICGLCGHKNSNVTDYCIGCNKPKSECMKNKEE